MSDKDLILYHPLDEVITDGKTSRFRDNSALKRDGELKGNVSLVTDDIFGACASFDGKRESYIEIADSPDLQIAGDITVEAWVNIAAAPADWVRFVGKGAADKRNYGLWYCSDRWLFQRNHNCEKLQSPTLNTWLHLAGTLQGSAASLYLHDLEGKLVFRQDASWSGPAPTSNDPLRIGCAVFHGAHAGRIAGVRVYKRALSQAEIERDIRLDCMRLVAFRKSHPIDFRLYDDDEQAVLYISEDAFGHNLRLELRNTSAQIIQMNDGPGADASVTNHHFALRFRPGTLSENMLKRLVNSVERTKILAPVNAGEWDLYFPAKPPAANEAAVLYLRYKGAKKSFGPNESRILTFQQVSAAPGSGARGAQVELAPRQLSVAGEDSTPITGSRTQYVHIANQRGRKNIPLHVGFVDGNTVLNNGDENPPLRLRITNVLREGDIVFKPKTGDQPTKLVISLDAQKVEEKDGKITPVGPLKDWALVTTEVANHRVGVKIDGINSHQETQGETPEWVATFEAERRLVPGAHLEIEISGIVTSLPTGHANLYVRHENIPGYWDGQFVCAVEKSPIVFRDVTHTHEKADGQKETVSHRGWVGVGNGVPQNLLHVGDGTSAIRDDRVQVVVTSKTPQSGIAIGQCEGVNVLLQASQAAGCIGTTSDHTLTLRTSDKDRVSIDKDGNVYMAGALTAEKFTGEGVLVKGMIVMWSGKSSEIPRGWALCDGNNNTPDLRDRFILGAAESFESFADEKRKGGQSSHKHSMNEAGGHTHGVDTGRGGSMSLNPSHGRTDINVEGNHIHAINETSTFPPYYKMAFIMRL
jgi:hypothetical protein